MGSGTSNTLSRFAVRFRELGWRRSFRSLLRFSVRLIFCRDYILILKRSTKPFPLPNWHFYRMVPIDAENTEAFAGGGLPYRKALFLARLARGAKGFFYVADDGSASGYHWYAEGKDYHEPYYDWTFGLKAHEVYLFDAYALPSRRGGIGPVQGFCRMFDLLRERGITTIYSAAAASNVRAWRFHLHFGFEPISCLEVTRVLRRPIRTREVGHEMHLPTGFREARARYAARKRGE